MGDNEEMVNLTEPVVPPVDDDDFGGISVIDDESTEEQVGPTAEELEALRLENERLKSTPQPSVDFSGLAQEIAKLQTPAKSEPSAPQIDPNKFMEEINANFHADPAKGMLKLLDPILKEKDQKSSEIINQQALQISKLTVVSDDNSRGIYTKYQDEIENMVKAMPPSSTVYKEAIDRVKAQHFDDIMAEQVQAKVDAAIQEALGKSTQAPAQPKGFTNATAVQTPQSQPTKVDGLAIHRKDLSKVPAMKAWALQKGFNWKDNDDKAFVIETFREKGAIS